MIFWRQSGLSNAPQLRFKKALEMIILQIPKAETPNIRHKQSHTGQRLSTVTSVVLTSYCNMKSGSTNRHRNKFTCVRWAWSFFIRLEVGSEAGCSLASASSSSSNLPLGVGVILSRVSRIFRAVSLDCTGTTGRLLSATALPLNSSSFSASVPGPLFFAW